HQRRAGTGDRRTGRRGCDLGMRRLSPTASKTSESQALSTHRTQFDRQLLLQSIASVPPVRANHGRHVAVLADGSVFSALAWGGAEPVLRAWHNHELLATHHLASEPSAACALVDGSGELVVLISIGDEIYRAIGAGAPQRISAYGKLRDATLLPDG